MDYVYICKDGDNEDLRYSIRSVVKNMPSGNVWVVGGKPDWYVGNYLEVAQDKPKYKNAKENLMAICNSKDISDTFILMNDDFFIMKPVSQILPYNGGDLSNKIDNYVKAFGNNTYALMLRKTIKDLLNAGIKRPLSYELHIPMVMDKLGLGEAIRLKNVLWRSYYGNVYGSPGDTIDDVKVYSKYREGVKGHDFLKSELPYLSTDDDSFELIKEAVLLKEFNEKTHYEK